MSDWAAGYVSDIEYTYGFYNELGPVHLSTVAMAHGVKSPPLKPGFAYCELGCGQGVTVNILAAANPDIEFYATDFNPGQIAGARELARAGGNDNAHFYEDSFAEFLARPELPDFDMITFHGIYSWVVEEHRRPIVEFIRRKLKPGGLVYNSYNCQPGWAAAAPMRHLMNVAGKRHGGPTISRVAPALDIMRDLEKIGATYVRANPAIKNKLELLQKHEKNYIAHEYFNDAWYVPYFADVAREMSDAKLGYLGSAHLLDELPALNFSAEQQQYLAKIPDPEFRETIKDYLVNRQFRRDVYVKGPLPLPGAQTMQAWEHIRLVLTRGRDRVKFEVRSPLGEARLDSPVYPLIVDCLADGPRTIGQLLSSPDIAAHQWLVVREAICALIGASQISVCRDAAGDAHRRKRTRVFNDALIAKAHLSGTIRYMASPVMGSGVTVDRVLMLFLAARAKKTPPAQYAFEVLKRENNRLIKGGRTLQTWEQNLAELEQQHALFETAQLPVLRQLGIAD